MITAASPPAKPNDLDNELKVQEYEDDVEMACVVPDIEDAVDANSNLTTNQQPA